VSALETKIGHAVIKIEWIKAHDVFTAAFVIAVAVPALGVFGVFYATMKTFFGFYVIFDVFMIMAVKAEFKFYEKMFALWHLLHLPLFFMLVITGIFHVIAVHYY